jgi:hypothetical protein
MSKATTVKSIFGAPETVVIGGFPFTKEYTLLVGESEWFESQSDKSLGSIKDLLTLAKAISENEAISEDEALGLIQDLDNEENKNILIKYSDNLAALKANSYTQENFKRDLAAMMLNSRVDRDFLIEHAEAINKRFKITLDTYEPVFTESMIRRFPVKLVDEIAEFTAMERLGWVEDDEDEAPVDEDLNLGK